MAGCACHYSMHLGYYGDSVAIQVPAFSVNLLQAIPRFQGGREAMRFRFSVRSFPSCIYGWPGKLTE